MNNENENDIKYKTLEILFPENKPVKVVTLTELGRKHLTPKMRWVYSAMIWRFERGWVNKHELSLWTGVDRTRTLPEVLSSLIKFGLVIQDGKKFKATVPSNESDWFANWQFTKSNKRALSYNWAVYSPGRDIIDGLVQASDAIEVKRASLLATFFGVDRKTITAARKRLKPVKDEKPIDRPVKTEDNKETTEPIPEPKQEEEMKHFSTDFLSVSGKQNHPDFLTRMWINSCGITEQDTIAQLEKFIASKKNSGMNDNSINQQVASLVHKFGIGVELADHICVSCL